MKNRTEQFKQLKAQMEEAKAKMVAEAKVVFNDIVKEIFIEFPNLEKFSWNQYTPYFNDGDECTFSVYGDDPDINGIDGEEICEASTYAKSSYPASHPELVPAKKAVAEFLTTAPEEMMKFVFGDHMTVTINRDGTTETDDCSHD